MKKRTSTLLIVLLFLAGVGLLLFPTLSNRYYLWQYDRAIAEWEASRPKEDYSQLWAAAEDYNRRLAEKPRQFSLTDQEEAEIATLLNPLGNGMMGFVDIEKIGVHLPIYQGTEDTSLQSGCGWWPGTSLPTGGESTHCVITAHTGLVKAKLFTDLDQMAVGDTFTLSILDRVLTYEVDQILVTEPEEFEPLSIVPGEDLATLYTCTPYGVNTHRLLVRGHRVETPADPSAPEDSSRGTFPWAVLLLPCAAAAVIVFLRKKRYNGKCLQNSKNSQRKGESSHQTDT